MRVDFFKRASILTVGLWLGIFSVLPLLYVLFVSFLTPGINKLYQYTFTLSNYTNLLNLTYLHVFLRSFKLALIVTVLTLLMGYPFAYFLANAKQKYKTVLLLFVIIPFWTSSLVRSYAMIAILKTKGILNTVLMFLGVIHSPMQILYTNTAVVIGLVYNLMPYMILPIYANAEHFDQTLVEAAHDLGANALTTLFRVIIPQTLPGIMAGCIIVFLPAMTLFYIPDILGGAKSMLLGNLIQTQFMFANNWPEGCAISVVLSLIMMLLLIIYWRRSKAKDRQLLI